MIIMFFGHGSFDPQEAPSHVDIPQACTLHLFTRHNEKIHQDRMSDVSWWIAQLASYEADPETRAEAMGYVNDKLIGGSHLRTIKGHGTRVHNYRLFPGLELPHNKECDDPSIQDYLKLVRVTEPTGRTLGSLFQEHGAPGTRFMWIACRAVRGQPGTLDVYKDLNTEHAERYVRPEAYFKGQFP